MAGKGEDVDEGGLGLKCAKSHTGLDVDEFDIGTVGGAARCILCVAGLVCWGIRDACYFPANVLCKECLIGLDCGSEDRALSEQDLVVDNIGESSACQS